LDPTADDLGVAEADIYQLLAYAHRYGCTDLELAYPKTRALAQLALQEFEIASSEAARPIRVRLRLIPLWNSDEPE
jgi:5-methylcytosine-specific restriction endonuclease McrBC regulatory subunit McrC